MICGVVYRINHERIMGVHHRSCMKHALSYDLWKIMIRQDKP